MMLLETLKLMEIEKLKKLNTETNLETALKEINDFVRSQAWSHINQNKQLILLLST